MRATSRSLVVTAVAAACGLLMTYAVAVLTPMGQYLDSSAMVYVADALADSQWAEQLLEFVSAASVAALTAGLTVLTAFARGPRPALAVALTSVGTVVAAEVLKAVLARPALLLETTSNSLPSGHVAAVAGLAVAAVMAVSADLRTMAASLGLAAVTATGLATVALQWHRPSDVLAAALLAVTVGALVATTTRTQPVGDGSPTIEASNSPRHDNLERPLADSGAGAAR